MHGKRPAPSPASSPAPSPAAGPHPGFGAALPLLLRLALREMRGGLRGFGIFLACIALGVAAIAGVASLSRSLTEGITREGRRILGGDMAFALTQREIAPQELAFLTARGAVASIASLRAMAVAGREGIGPRGAQGRRRGLSGGRHPGDRSAGARRGPPGGTRRALRRRGGPGPARPPRPQGRRSHQRRPGALRDPGEPGLRARQDRQRHRLRAAAHGLPGGLAGDRPHPARKPGALDLPAEPRGPLRRRGPRADRGRGQDGPSGGRMGDAHPRQRGSALCPQHRALHPVPDPGRPDRAAGGRRGRRQRGARLRRPQARLDRHAQEPRGPGRAGGAALPAPGHDHGARGGGDRPRGRGRAAVRASSSLFGAPAADPDPADAGLGRTRHRAPYGLLTAFVFALAPPRPRPRRAGLRPVPRPDRARAPLAAPALPGSSSVCGGGPRGPRRRLRPTIAGSP